MTSTPPGWYDYDSGGQRWWDGERWTEHTSNPDASTPAGEASQVRSPSDPGLPPELSGADATAPLPPYAGGQAYPGVHPGSPPSGGAFVAATESKKSRTWIVWLVVGIVLLGIVIAAAVLIPVFFLSLASGGAQPSGDDQEQAVAAVELYDEAWREVDCDKFFAATTENFREGLQLTDCETFEPSAQSFADSIQNYALQVTSIEQNGSSIVVSTSETYDSFYDENGEPADPPVPFEDQYSYEVVSSDGGWAIDDAS